jgi:hypothetical protein
MASVTINPPRAGQVVDRAGADPDIANYDSATNTLTCDDVDQPTLDAARAAVASRTATARPKDKQQRRAEIRRRALRAHEQAILDADAVFQAKLTEINAAATVADLEAIDYP